DIGFARLRPVRAPTIFVSPPQGPAGQVITIVGDGFAARQREVFIEVDGVVISSFPTDGAGRFTATIFVPVSGEGPHLIRAIDVLGNVAESTYYTSFGFNNINEQLRLTGEETAKKLEEILKAIPEGVDVDKLADSVAARLKPELSKNTSNQMAEIALGVAVVAVAAAVASILLSNRGRGKAS
ncbi:MAG: hypothetical protein QW544_01715, partial [Candidatus Caldarchaeum sp.]